MDSIWTKTVNLPHFEALQGDKKTEMLIIGGGMAGLLCAFFLQEQGVDCLLAEGRTICSGVTKNTTAKITSQHGLIYQDIAKYRGLEITAKYLEANETALAIYAAMAEQMDCDFERKTNYVYSIDNRKKMEEEVKILERIGFPVRFQENTELPIRTAGAVSFPEQAQFHPLKFVKEISKNLHIYEHTFVKELKPHTAVTDHGSIDFDQVIFATHFPIINKHGMYFLKMYQHRSYVIAYENAQKLEGMYIDESESGFSFRNYGDLLYLGGGSHRTGKPGGGWQEIRNFAREVYPFAKEEDCWATQDCMSLDQIPYIGAYAKGMPNAYVATGFNKWGMTSSMIAAKILCDLVQGRQNPYADLFSPQRPMRKKQLLQNGAEAAKNLLSFRTKRCPHLGCALRWNALEHTWDCPCHGSRFDEKGGLIDGPAMGDLLTKNKQINIL